MITTYKKNYIYVVLLSISVIQHANAFTGTSRATGNWSSASSWMLTRTGTIAVTIASTAVIGTGTNFTNELENGNVIMTNSGIPIGTVSSITDNTHLTLSSIATLSYSDPYTVQKVPAATDNAVIADLTVITATSAFSISNLTIGQGLLGILTFSAASDFTSTITGNIIVNNGGSLIFPAGGAVYTLDVSGDITINTGGAIDAATAGNPATHFLNLSGNITNNGSCSLLGSSNKAVEISFVGITNAIVSGIGSWTLYNVTINKSTLASTLEIQAAGFSNALTGGNALMTQGTFIHNCTGTWNYMDDARLGTPTTNYSINSNVKIWVKSGTVNFVNNATVKDVNPTTTIASGNVVVDGGILNIATGADNYFNICSSDFTVNGGTVNIGGLGGTNGIRFFKPTATVPSMNITGGTVNVAGTIAEGAGIPSIFSMTGGTLNLASGTGTASTHTFQVQDVASSSFTMSNGTIVIQKPSTGTSDFAICGTTGTVNVTGGLVQFGNTSTNNNTTFRFTPFCSAVTNNVFPNIKLAGTTGDKLNPISTCDFRFLSLYISANNTFDFVNAASNNLTLTGTYNGSNAFYNDGTLTQQTSTITFGGSVNQGIAGATTTLFNNVTINNVGGVTLYNPETIAAVLTLTNGLVTTTSTNILTMNAGSSSTSGSSVSFVNGPMDKVGSTAFAFPVGKGSKWARIGIGAPTAASTFRAEYFDNAYTNTTPMATSPTPVLNRVSIREYWTLDRTNGTGNATVTLYWEDAGFSGINDCSTNYLRVAHWNGAAWENNNNVVTTTGTCGTFGSIATSSVVNSFSPFTFGTIDPLIDPLPIELLSFETKVRGNIVDITWATASEINNDFFTIEKTTNAIEFEDVANVKGNGNSTSVINYGAIDEQPTEGVSFYRLKQTDFDGNQTYSELRKVRFEKNSDFYFNIFPNPSDDGLFKLQINSNQNEDVLVVVYDTFGNVMYSKVIITNNNGSVVYAFDPSRKLNPGVYMITASSHQTIYNKRLIVN